MYFSGHTIVIILQFIYRFFILFEYNNTAMNYVRCSVVPSFFRICRARFDKAVYGSRNTVHGLWYSLQFRRFKAVSFSSFLSSLYERTYRRWDHSYTVDGVTSQINE